MNPVLITCCVLAALALLPAQTIRGVLATAAASLFEGTPFILAGVLLQTLAVRALSRNGRIQGRLVVAASALLSRLPAYLGCGCATGPGALSLPAAVATALVFGPIPALLRFGAATLSANLSSRANALASVIPSGRGALRLRCFAARSGQAPAPSDVEGGGWTHCSHSEPLLAQLTAMLPAVLLAGVAMHAFADVRLDRASPSLQWLGGAIFGFAASPCALGAVAIAASLHARAPFAAMGMLCVSGIIDLRTLVRAHDHEGRHDALSYTLLALALAFVAVHGGDELVSPRFTLALLGCAFVSLALAVVHRRAQFSPARIPPAIMLAGALLVAPSPIYHATQTTLANLFPGERVTFTGTVVHGKDADALVRFAITCCRADASPVVLRLARRVHYPGGVWLLAQGAVVRSRSTLAFHVDRLERIAPPADPFVYR